MGNKLRKVTVYIIIVLTMISISKVKAAPLPYNIQGLLPVQKYKQETMAWCWASCIQSVIHYYAKNFDLHATPNYAQEEIVSLIKGIDVRGKRDFTGEELLSQGGTPIEMERALSSYGVKTVYRIGALSFERVVEEIMHRRPIIIGIKTHGVSVARIGTAHAVVICGFKYVENAEENKPIKNIAYVDPDPGFNANIIHLMDYDKLISNDKTGWYDTLLTHVGPDELLIRGEL